MTDKIDTTFRRRLAQRTQDNTKWTPRDALVAGVDMIDQGSVDIERLTVHMLVREPDGGESHQFLAANLSYEEHIALLELAKKRALEDWWS